MLANMSELGGLDPNGVRRIEHTVHALCVWNHDWNEGMVSHGYPSEYVAGNAKRLGPTFPPSGGEILNAANGTSEHAAARRMVTNR